MTLVIRPRAVGYVLGGTIATLLFLHLLFHFGRLEFGWGQSYGLRRLFDFGREGNIPTAYSALALLAAAMCLLLISNSKFSESDRFRFAWLGLGLGFLFLSIDEAAQLHENMFRISRALGIHGTLAWMLPYAVILPVLAAVYWPFFLHLERRFRLLFVLCALLLVGGALGMEASGDLVRVVVGDEANWPNTLIMTAEELFEMSGVAIFLVTLLVYAEETIGSFTVTFR